VYAYLTNSAIESPSYSHGAMPLSFMLINIIISHQQCRLVLQLVMKTVVFPIQQAIYLVLKPALKIGLKYMSEIWLTKPIRASDITISQYRLSRIQQQQVYRRHESVKLLQYYCLEFLFEYICDLQKWKYLSNTAGCPSRAAIFTILKGAQCIICP